MENKDPQKNRISRTEQNQYLNEFEEAGEELDLRELFLKLSRRRKAIAGIFFLVVVMTALYLYQATPRYTAQALLTLDLRKSKVVNIEDVLSGLSANDSVLGTEMDILRSSYLLEKVLDKLQLDKNPHFNPALVAEDDKSVLRKFREWLRGLWFLSSDTGVSPEEQEKRLRLSIVSALQNNLVVEHRKQSNTISVSYTSLDPKEAAKVINTLADLYLTDQLEAKFEATRRANEWLAKRLENLRQEVQTAEQAVTDMRERNDMIKAGSTTLFEQHISDINAQLIQARLKKSRAEARLSQAREVMNRPGGIESLDKVLDSKTIQELRSVESTLRRKKAELSQRYGAKHPQMIQVEAEMKDLQSKIKEEANRILESLENEVQVARAEEQTLMRSLDNLRKEAGQVMDAEIQVRELERQATSARTLYENFLNRFQETREQDDLARPDARIISRAEVPLGPSHPKKKMILALGIVGGLMLGVMGALLLEALDRGFRTGDQVEKFTGQPLLGSIPLLEKNQGVPSDYVITKPFSSLTESLRAIRTAIQLSNVDHPPKTIMATSALPSEGKTSFCTSLAKMAAVSKTKTLVIDADLRRPSLAKLFPDLKPEKKLEDILQEANNLKEAIAVDPKTGLHLIMAHGHISSSVGELLSSQRMKQLLEKLKEHYELIILDTPPIMGVSDAWTLATQIDALVFLVRWAETPRETVQAALRHMDQLGIEVSGMVLSMVNVRQQSKYGYGGYGYYYGKYKKYYHD
jgi:capsular exopolysaccharide synthesis family protein